MAKKKKTRKKIIELDIKKRGMSVVLGIKAEKRLEDFFRNMSEGKTAVSSKWRDNSGNGLLFYKGNDKLELFRKQLVESGIYCFDDFGSGFFHKELEDPNVALLRIVGIGKGVKIKTDDFIAFEDLKLYVEKLARVVKEIYQNFLLDTNVKARISYDMD